VLDYMLRDFVQRLPWLLVGPKSLAGYRGVVAQDRRRIYDCTVGVRDGNGSTSLSRPRPNDEDQPGSGQGRVPRSARSNASLNKFLIR
jgi:hypothetical protein